MTTAALSSSKAAIHSHLFFGGRCDEALAFYTKAVGARVGMVMRFDESPEPAPAGMLPPGFEKKVMHAEFHVGGTMVMASDGCVEGAAFSGFSLALSLPTEEDVDRAFAALSEDGKVTMPPAKTFWSPRFGMLTDKFGVEWMVMAAGQPANG